MGTPHAPGSPRGALELPCGLEVQLDEFDMGMREYQCACGERHAVVMDVHPLGRWIPESIVDILATVIEPRDDHETFDTIHLMGIVLEEFPDKVTVQDASEDPSVGWALLWVTSFDTRRLHHVIVELLVELMDHAIGHSEDEDVQTTFQGQLTEFDVEAFVEEYRSVRDFESERDRPV